MNINNGSKNMSQWFMLFLAVIFLISISAFVPFLIMVNMIIVPGFLSVLFLKSNNKISVLSLLISFMILYLFSNLITAGLIVLLYLIITCILIYSVKNKIKVSFSLLLLVIGVTLSICIFLYGISNYVYTGGFYSLVDTIVKGYKQDFYNTLTLYKNMNINANSINEMKTVVDGIKTNQVLRIIPGNIIVTSIVISFLTYRFTEFLFARYNLNINPIKQFSQWHVNDMYAAAAIGMMSIGIILQSKNIELGIYIVNSAIIASTFLFDILGISVVTYFLRVKYKIAKSMLIFLIIILFVFRFEQLFFFLGIVDSIVNFRNPKIKKIMK